MLITSLHNEYIKELVKLKQKKVRDQRGKFLIETKHLVLEAFRAGLIEELILEKDEIFPLDVKTTYVTREILKKLSMMDTPSKVMAVVRKPEYSLEKMEKILILDRIQDPGNLGTIIRSAKAFNFDLIVTSLDTTDIYNSKTIRSSQGMFFHIPVVTKELIHYINILKEDGYKIVGTKVTNGKDVKEASIYSHFALVIGNEGQGMSEEVEALCDEFLYIKMSDDCESLNASVAASILMYEINSK